LEFPQKRWNKGEIDEMDEHNVRVIIRNLVIEFVIYAILLVGYFFAVLRLLDDILERFFENNIVVYAFLGLALIVAQGVLLETLTSYLIRWLELERLEEEG
jgi:hypothetical protein